MNLTDTELILRLKARVKDETAATIDILLYLQEVKARKLDLKKGFSSMYKFVYEELGYDKDRAYPRFRAAELLDVDPRVAQYLKDKKLSLTSMMQIQIAFLKHKKLTKAEKLVVIEKVVGSSTRGAKRVLAECYPGAKKDHESTKPLAGNLTLIQFVATPEMMEMFEKLKNMQAHRNLERRWDSLFFNLAKDALKEPKPRKPRAKSSGETKTSDAKRKKISVHIERSKRNDADHRCQFVSEEGVRCNETHGLQMDHVLPLALGGTNSIDNLRILCGGHNRFCASEMGLEKPAKSEKSLDKAP